MPTKSRLTYEQHAEISGLLIAIRGHLDEILDLMRDRTDVRIQRRVQALIISMDTVKLHLQTKLLKDHPGDDPRATRHIYFPVPESDR